MIKSEIIKTNYSKVAIVFEYILKYHCHMFVKNASVLLKNLVKIGV